MADSGAFNDEEVNDRGVVREGEDEDDGRTFSVDDAIESVGCGRYQKRLLGILGLFSMAEAMEVVCFTVLLVSRLCAWPGQWQRENMCGDVGAQSHLKPTDSLCSDLSPASTGVFYWYYCISPIQAILVFVSVLFAEAIGSYFWGAFADKYGRSKALIWCSRLFVIPAIVSVFSWKWYIFILTRILAGFAISGVNVSFTLFVEFLPWDSRINYLTVLRAFWLVGIFIEAGVAYALSDGLMWIMLLITALPMAIVGVASLFLTFIPESPRWLLLNDNTLEGATDVLHQLATGNSTTLPPGRLTINSKIYNVMKKGKYADNKIDLGGTFKVLKKNRQLRNTTTMLWTMWFLTGCMFFGVVVTAPFLLSNDTNQNGYAIKLLAALFTLAAYGITPYMLRRHGRRFTLLWNAGSTAAWLLIPIFLALIKGSNYVVAFIKIFLITSSILTAHTVFIALYVTTPEVYPTQIRGSAMGLQTGLSKLGGLIVLLIVVIMLGNTSLHPLIIAFFFACSAVATFAAYKLPPDVMDEQQLALQDTVLEEDETLKAKVKGFVDDEDDE